MMLRWKLPRAQVRFVCDEFAVLRKLASAGAGITFLPENFAAPYVLAGKLETLHIPGRAFGVPHVLLYPSSGQVPRKVVAFRDFLLEWREKT